MRFWMVLAGAVMVSGALGGTLAHVGMPRSIGDVTGSASDVFHSTMRKFDGRYYTRGGDYAVCVREYGRSVHDKTNAEITLSCECLDKSMGMLGGIDRQTALGALNLNDKTAAAGIVPVPRVTAAAQRVLRKCGIFPATPAMSLPLRGGL